MTLWVDSVNGSDATGTGSSTNPFRSLERAQQAAWERWHADRIPLLIVMRMGTYRTGPYTWPVGTKLQPAAGLRSWVGGPDQMVVAEGRPDRVPLIARLLNVVEELRLRAAIRRQARR